MKICIYGASASKLDTAYFESAEELNKAMGFPVEDIQVLPVEAKEIRYEVIAGELVQEVLLYEGADGTGSSTEEEEDAAEIVFRKSAGEEDNSGDYNQYDSEKDVQVNGTAMTLKGNDGTVSLILWQRDGYSYSMGFTPAVPEEDAVSYAGAMLR